MNIPYDNNYTIINIYETACSLEMELETTIEKKIGIITLGKESYRISIILPVVGNGYKFPPLLIIKGEPGNSIEIELRLLSYVREKNIFIYCQPYARCHLTYSGNGLMLYLNPMK